jgi:CBS domain-containing protein
VKNKPVRDVMAIGVPACKPTTSLPSVAQLLSQEAREILVVMGDGGVEGVVSQSDLARAFLGDYASMAAKDVMSPQVYSLSPDVPLEIAVKEMIEKGVHQMLVASKGQEKAAPLGVLSKRHIVELMAE